MNVVVTFTPEEVDAIQLSISDAQYWARQMYNSGNHRDAETLYSRVDVLMGVLARIPISA
jgi:hypothetical protein